MKPSLPVLVITLCAVAGGALAQSKATLPADVAKFIDRRAGCNYFAGEPPYDKNRVAFLNKQMADLHCKSIGAEEMALMRRYSGSQETMEAIRQSRYATQD